MLFKKNHKVLFKKKHCLSNYNHCNFDFLVISKECSIFTQSQFNSIQKEFGKVLKRDKKNCLFFFIRPYFYLTSKPSESRMGGGKGNLDEKVFYVKKGQAIYGLKNLPVRIVLDLVSQISYKLPVKVSLIRLKY